MPPFHIFHAYGPWIYDKHTCTRTKICTKDGCNKTQTEPAHDYVDWDFIQSDSCVQYRRCKNCNKTETREVAHDFGDWKYHSEKSCEKKRACKHCGFLEFAFEHQKIVEAVSVGNECLVEARCIRCGEITQVKEQHNWSEDVLPYTDCLAHATAYLEEKKQTLADIVPKYAKDPLNPNYVALSAELLSLPSKQQQYKDRKCIADPDDIGVFCTRCKKPRYLGRKAQRIKNKKGFLSYAWNDMPHANRIDDSLRESGIYITRDIRDLDIGTNLHEFMNRVETSSYVVVIISDSYLKSKNCMYEAIKIVSALIKKQCLLLPIVIDLDIANKQLWEEYIQYWGEKIEAAKDNNDSAQDRVIYREILDSIAEFLTMIVRCKYEKVASADDIDEALVQKIKNKIKTIE